MPRAEKLSIGITENNPLLGEILYFLPILPSIPGHPKGKKETHWPLLTILGRF
jgi:hypothetical protein